jgi:hypothetical protein
MGDGGKQGYRFCDGRRTMSHMLTLLIITTGLTLFGLASVRFGTDSRPVFDEHREGERFGVLR